MDQLAAAIGDVAAASGFAGAVRVDLADDRIDEAYGLADREHAVANTPGTRFAMASGSKAFTALMVMRLVERGARTLATPARELLGADLPLIAHDVTVEHLLAHRSGIGDYLDEDTLPDVAEFVPPVDVATVESTEAFLPWLAGHPTKFPAGERFNYCNGGYVVLALLAERATGRGFHDLVDEHVFGPAGLADTAYLRTDELPADAALGYLYAPDHPGALRTNAAQLPVRGNGDGGAYTTTDDMRRFWLALFEGRVVEPATLSEMTRPHSTDAGGGRRYGLGFWLAASGPGVSVEGSDAGVSFRSVHEPDGSPTWTVASNWTDGAWPVARELRTRLSAG